MFTLEDKHHAVETYHRFGGSATKAVRFLGYPTIHTLLGWVKDARTDMLRYRKPRRFFTDEEKRIVLDRCYNRGESLEVVAAEIEVAGKAVINAWKTRLEREGRLSAVPRRKVPRPSPEIRPPPDELGAAQAEVERLRLQVAILEETIATLKKDRGADRISNREKAVTIDALRTRTGLTLPTLLNGFGLARSSYHYARNATRRPDRHAARRVRIRAIFEGNNQCFGYRRIHAMLKRDGDSVSEKVVRRLMRQEDLVVKLQKKRKYTSYVGEISPAPPNLLQGDFHAERPNETWVTDLTEFSIPAGKVYLSPILDCHGGCVVSWSSGTAPTAELANASLRAALATLIDEHPILHSDRGSHYRWPDWIELAASKGLRRSMSRKGCTGDNAACEGFFGHLKTECFNGRSFRGVSLEDFQRHLDESIVWFNEDRIKVSLGGLTPAEYRVKYLAV
jgi:putative transposase